VGVPGCPPGRPIELAKRGRQRRARGEPRVERERNPGTRSETPTFPAAAGPGGTAPFEWVSQVVPLGQICPLSAKAFNLARTTEGAHHARSGPLGALVSAVQRRPDLHPGPPGSDGPPLQGSQDVALGYRRSARWAWSVSLGSFRWAWLVGLGSLGLARWAWLVGLGSWGLARGAWLVGAVGVGVFSGGAAVTARMQG